MVALGMDHSKKEAPFTPKGFERGTPVRFGRESQHPKNISYSDIFLSSSLSSKNHSDRPERSHRSITILSTMQTKESETSLATWCRDSLVIRKEAT